MTCRASLPWNTPACRSCALPLPTASAAGPLTVCLDCLRAAPPQDRTWAAFRYEPPISAHVLDLKFHAGLASGHLLGALMAERLAARPEPLPELLLPVPLHDGRLRRRGYNQALELAREMSRRLCIPLSPTAARRQRRTAEQTRLSAGERRRNVRGAFAVEADVRGRHVALVDDVITTGATVAELARRLRRAGARRIEAWAAARAV